MLEWLLYVLAAIGALAVAAGAVVLIARSFGRGAEVDPPMRD